MGQDVANVDRIKAFVINVETNTFRREHFMAQADRIGLPVELFRAITPDAIEAGLLKYDENRARRFTGRPMMPTERACAASHLTLWRQLEADNEADHYLILEDDAIFSTNIADVLNAIDLPSEGFIKLSGKKKRPMKQVQQLADGRDLVRFAYGPLDTAAYLVSKSSAARLRHYCERMFTPLDLMMDRAYDHGVPVYGVLPYPVYADFDLDPNSPLFSDIGMRGKFADDITPYERVMVRLSRIWGSVKRSIAAWTLRFR